MMSHSALLRLLGLSVAAALATTALKTTAWALTGSVGRLSDAAESVVNLVAALVGLAALCLVFAPADEQHAHRQTKAEYFSAGAEKYSCWLPRSASRSPASDVFAALSTNTVSNASMTYVPRQARVRIDAWLLS